MIKETYNKMGIKRFGLKEFPVERIRVLLKDNKKFLDENITYFGSLHKLANFLSVSPQLIYHWKNLNLFIPLKFIKKIINKRKLDWTGLERDVVAYKGPNLSLSVRNPKLPIIESPELFTIISHLIGDGSVNRNGIPIYTNSNKDLIDNFIECLNKTFGTVEGKLYFNKRRCYQYRFSKVIPDLLKSFYNVDFGSLTAKFPTRIFELPGEYSCAVIRAIVDDEGAVRDNRISIKMKNKYLVMQLRNMLIRVLGKKAVTNLVAHRGYFWEFGVRAAYLKTFEVKIKLIHSTKRDNLEYVLKKSAYRSIKQKDDIWKTKLKILKILVGKSQTINDLSRELFIDKGNVILHIKDLENKLLIKKVKYNRSFKCSLTKKGHIFIEESLPSSEKIRVNLMEIIYNALDKQHSRILLSKELRYRLFWFLRIVCKNQDEIGKLFNVHRNTISNWKSGNTLIPSSTLNRMFVFLGKKGVNLVNGINTNIEKIKIINEGYKIYGGISYDIHLCKPTFA